MRKCQLENDAGDALCKLGHCRAGQWRCESAIDLPLGIQDPVASQTDPAGNNASVLFSYVLLRSLIQTLTAFRITWKVRVTLMVMD